MKANIQNKTIDFSKPIDISLPITNDEQNPIAWYQNAPKIEPVSMDNWIGKVASGTSSTNFNTIVFNPHAHGTHTECLGHITSHFYSINQNLKTFFFWAKLISIQPETVDQDLVITKEQLEDLFYKIDSDLDCRALVLRTLPNMDAKKSMNYSHSNPPYLSEAASKFIRESGIEHLLIDLPSVDKEKDEGKLLAHKAFWNVTDIHQLNADARLEATITEMIFVPNEVPDGLYLLNLQIVSFENDASPSKPILYAIEH